MYYDKPDVKRLSELELPGFELNDKIIFCPNCSFQLEKDAAMKPVCPVCRSGLHITTVDKELLDLVRESNE